MRISIALERKLFLVRLCGNRSRSIAFCVLSGVVHGADNRQAAMAVLANRNTAVLLPRQYLIEEMSILALFDAWNCTYIEPYITFLINGKSIYRNADALFFLVAALDVIEECVLALIKIDIDIEFSHNYLIILQ